MIIKKYLAFFFVFFLLLSSDAHASSLKINAGILPTLWYSALDAYEGDTVKIYGAIQNHSDFKFSGDMQMVIDGKVYKSTSFVSPANSLTELDFSWKSIAGNHDMQIRIAQVAGAGIDMSVGSLTQSVSDISHFSVTRKIDFAETKDTVVEIATSGIQKIDDAAASLADKILALEKPYSTSTARESKGEVLGASTKYSPSNIYETIKDSNVTKGIWNTIIDFLALAVRHWRITLTALVLLGILIKYALT